MIAPQKSTIATIITIHHPVPMSPCMPQASASGIVNAMFTFPPPRVGEATARLASGARHRHFVLQHATKLVPQLRRVLLAVHRGGVLGRGAEDVVLLAREVEGAADVVRVVAAVDPLACHGISLSDGLSALSSLPAARPKRRPAPRGRGSPSRRSSRLRAAGQARPS